MWWINQNLNKNFTRHTLSCMEIYASELRGALKHIHLHFRVFCVCSPAVGTFGSTLDEFLNLSMCESLLQEPLESQRLAFKKEHSHLNVFLNPQQWHTLVFV